MNILYPPVCHIMNSDEDQPAVADIDIGFNSRKELVVVLSHSDYVSPEMNDCISAVMISGDTAVLAQRRGVPVDKLPDIICDEMKDYSDIINADFDQVEQCFKAITDLLLDEGCHFRIVDETRWP